MSKRRDIQIFSENCTGCQLCKLACSYVKTASFSLSRSFVVVARLGTTERYQVSFTPECDRCGFCVSYCCFGAIRRGRTAVASGRAGSQ